MTFASRITGGIHSRSTVQGFHFQTRIIGKAVQTVVLIDIFRLLAGIPFQRVRRFGDVRMAIDVVQAEHLYPIAQYLAHLVELVRVVRCKNQFSFHINSLSLTG